MTALKIKTIERPAPHKKSKSLAYRASMILIALAVVFLISALIFSRTKTAKTGIRQAVFTTTGRIYFGYVKDKSANMVEIRDAYYLNNMQSLTSSKPEDKISLIRMGSEIYKPDNIITINSEHIVFIQDLNPDSQINAAIFASKQGK
jgi:archaellum biogenesis protein FlaJ (TadC family)